MREFKTILLDKERTPLAFPLIHALLPELSLADWCAYAYAIIGEATANGGQCGILAAENEGGSIAGLVIFRVQRDLRHGATLAVEHLVAFDLLDRELVARALAQELERTAHRHGCRAIHTILPDGRRNTRGDHANWLVDLLEDSGHRIEGLALCKLVPAR